MTAPHRNESMSRRFGFAPLSWAEVGALSVPVLVCLVLGINRLVQPDALTGVLGYVGWGYDDGVHLGTALRLTQFDFPYRDYVLLHPPGTSVVLAPLAIVGRLTNTHDALALGRIIVALIGVANVALVAMLVRRRGPLAMLIGGMALAIWPLAPDALRTLMMEPFVVLFVLLGALVLFPSTGTATFRRVFWAGTLFGAAVSLRMLSLLPLLAALLVVCWTWRRTLKPFVLGVIAALGVLVLPFFLLAPSQFIQQVIVSQLSRPTSNVATTSVGVRLAMIIGLSSKPSQAQADLAVMLFLVFAVVVIVTFFLLRRATGPLDWFALFGSVLTVVGVLRAPEAFWHYMYVSAAFLALLLAMTVGLIAGAIPAPKRAGQISWRWLSGVTLSTVVILAGLSLIPHDIAFAKSFPGKADDPSEWIDKLVPAGSCVVSDVATILVVSNRLVSTSRDCPATVDSYGAWLNVGDNLPPGQAKTPPAELVESWKSDLKKLDYLVLSVDLSSFFPWTAETKALLANNFRKVGTRGTMAVYERI